MPGDGNLLHGSRRTDRHLRDRRMQFCVAEVGGDLEQAADDEGQNQEQRAAGYVGNVSQGGEMPEPTVVPTPRAITAPRPSFLPRSLVLDIDNVSPFTFCAATVHTEALSSFFRDCLPIYLCRARQGYHNNDFPVGAVIIIGVTGLPPLPEYFWRQGRQIHRSRPPGRRPG